MAAGRAPDRGAEQQPSLYVPLGGDRWLATGHTAGPWDPSAQHGGPPSALLARAIERTAPRPELAIGRITVEILGPVPVGELTVRADVVRSGRNVELVEAVLSAAGREVARAAAWRIRRAEGADVPPRMPAPPPFAGPPLPPPAAPRDGAGAERADQRPAGFAGAVDWVPGRGELGGPGPAAAWVRLRHALVAGEPTSPLQRLVALADNGNGISSEVDFTRHYFINPELTVHLHREPVGEWICVDATTTISPGGTGLATSVLSDLTGPVAVGAQALLVGPRPGRHSG
ncbi:MAG: thioesterase family protein [Frankia sp.]|nr:thioesterase family protein [Frankia sp.]